MVEATSRNLPITKAAILGPNVNTVNKSTTPTANAPTKITKTGEAGAVTTINPRAATTNEIPIPRINQAARETQHHG
jgi:hypothetical protein